MSRAWDHATGLLRANSRVVSVMAGVFFFLPVSMLILLLPDLSQNPAFAGDSQDPAAMAGMINAVLGEIWWAIVLATVMQIIGMLALYRLLSDRARPTVREALAFGAKALLPFVGASLLLQVIQILLTSVLGGLAAGTALAGPLSLVGLALTIWLTVRFLPTGPVVAIERCFNPFKVLRRAWQLTAGNAARLFAFFVLLIAAFVVLWIVAALVFTLVFGLMGPEASRFGFALVTGAAMAAYFAIYVGVQVAIHRQLAGEDRNEAARVF
ncbi:hypothetical protein WAB17_02620 [Parerythrobacter aurantius]|uniref:glycerophosphoryl diester phosphodiesterase membrane domain-containing protein n=1 Tax=Parerythrobacter aurantius TaxID=3127706 RepID=UPI00325008C8